MDFGDLHSIGVFNDEMTKSTDGNLRSTLTQVNHDTDCVIVNTAYFKGTWDFDFDKEMIKEDRFRKSNGTKLTCLFICKERAEVLLQESDESVVVCIRYSCQKIKLVLEMPKTSGEISTPKLSAEEILKIGKATQYEKVSLKIPLFKAETHNDIKEDLKDFGIKSIFENSPDFKGISSACPSGRIPKITRFIHQAFFELSEDGCKGTGSLLEFAHFRGGGLIEKQIKPVGIDKPFHFHLLDSKNDLILMSGSVYEPTPTHPKDLEDEKISENCSLI